MNGTARDKFGVRIAQAAQTRDGFDVAGVEAAVLDWARYDQQAAQSVSNVTTHRLKYLTTLFEDTGPTAASYAQLFYATYLGLNHLDGDRVAVLKLL